MPRRPLAINQVQERLYDTLCVVRSAFDGYGVRYFVSFGTLLGTVRHHGFIPWDDDIDIHIHEDDYEMALRSLEASLPNHLRLQLSAADISWDIDFRVVDGDTLVEREGLTEQPDVSDHLCIDFFIAERCSPKLASLHAIYKKVKHDYQRRLRPNDAMKYFFVKNAYRLAKKIFTSKTHWFVNDKVQNVSFASDDIWPVTYARFVQGEFPVPAHPDHLLTAWYGDYHTLPKSGDRKSHFTACYLIYK